MVKVERKVSALGVRSLLSFRCSAPAMVFAQSKDISIAWTCFLLKIVGLWLAADKAEQRRRNFTLSYTIGAILIATCIAVRDIYFSWGNFSDCVYIACNISYLMIVFFKIAVLYAHRTEFYSLITFTQNNFWHSNYDYQERSIVEDCAHTCAIFIVVLSFCAQGTCAGYMVTPILANIGKNQSERILPFNMWVEFPTGMSPYFEVFFSIQILCVYHVGVCYICFDNFLCLVCLHVASQFRILQSRLLDLNDVLTKRIDHGDSDTDTSIHTNQFNNKLKSCVQLHQMLTGYCKKLENIFTLIVLGQVLFLALVLCLVGYQLLLAETPPSRNVSLVLNFLGTMCQLLMFTYSCDGLISQSTNVGKAILSSPWTNLPMDRIGRTVRKNVIIIIMRTNKNCGLTAGGFFPVSLETYTGVLSTAMSYFTLLRQSSLKLTNT